MILEAIIFIAAIILVSRSFAQQPGSRKVVAEVRINPKVAQELEYAERLFGGHKYLAAEKGFLEVLKHDHKNVTAYDKLVKIYLALKNYPDAIECSHILAQLEPTAHNYFQLGQVFYENKNYVKAVAAFEKSIMFEPSAGRYAALGKCLTKLSNYTKATNALEKAVEIDPDKRNLEQLAELYRLTKNTEKLQATRAQLKQLQTSALSNDSRLGKLEKAAA